MDATKLKLERKDQDASGVIAGGLVMMTPAIGEDYWAYRVIVGEHQAIIGFPKFMTIGIGFAIEDDNWNTNLPYTSPTNTIWQHIRCNKGDASIPDELCVEAIRMVQEAATADRKP